MPKNSPVDAKAFAFDRTHVRQHWPKLSEEDVARIGTDRETLVRAIEDRYVCSNLEAEEQVAAVEDHGSAEAARSIAAGFRP
jgi:hypothetical protein